MKEVGLSIILFVSFIFVSCATRDLNMQKFYRPVMMSEVLYPGAKRQLPQKEKNYSAETSYIYTDYYTKTIDNINSEATRAVRGIENAFIQVEKIVFEVDDTTKRIIRVEGFSASAGEKK